MVTERARVRRDGLEEVQRLFAVGRQRQHARSGTVAGPEDERPLVCPAALTRGDSVVACRRRRVCGPALANQSGEACDAVGVVERVLDVGVVEELEGHDFATGPGRRKTSWTVGVVPTSVGQSAVFDLHTPVLYDTEPRVLGACRGLVVADAELEPDRLYVAA